MKRCSKCDEWKALDEFHAGGKGQGARKSQCKMCVSVYGGAYRNRSQAYAAKMEMRRAEAAAKRGPLAAGHKKCRKCGEVKALGEFDKHKSGGFGRLGRCKVCDSDRTAARNARNYQRYKEVRKAKVYARRRADPSASRAATKAWKAANPVKAGSHHATRHARLVAQADGSITSAFVRALYRESTLCPYCMRGLSADNRHLDHCQPLVRGGLHSIDNLVVCCSECNTEKYTLPFLAWVLKIGDLARA